jgi:hypothetical protein
MKAPREWGHVSSFECAERIIKVRAVFALEVE